MAYKKYIVRGGKKYGPYFYESSRDETGKVINRYVSRQDANLLRGSSSVSTGKLWLLAFGLAAIAIVILLLIISSLQQTGNVSLDLQTSYASGEKLQGEIKFGIASGEFIPAESVIILQLGDFTKEALLSDVASGVDVSSGDFFAEGTILNGSGEGYGGNESINLGVDISQFDISAEQGTLSAKLVYGDVEIASAEEEIVIEVPVGEPAETPAEEPAKAPVEIAALDERDVNTAIRGPRGAHIDATVEFENKGNKEKIQVSGQGPNRIESGKYDIFIRPNNGPLKEVRIKDVDVNGSINGLVDVDVNLTVPYYANAYAIDPTVMSEFVSADVTATAKGRELYKCKDWDFDSQVCLGEWVKFMDLTPGEDYIFVLTAEDPAFAEGITDCYAQELQTNQSNFPTSCDGVYPSACGATGDLAGCNDGFLETHSMSVTGWAGLQVSQYNTSVTDCTNITNVSVCFEWWTVNAAGPINCNISVDNQGGRNFTAFNTTCPGSTADPGITCQDVTRLKNWTCSNFFGSTGNKSLIRAQAIRSSGAAGKVISWDLLAFSNISYSAQVDNPPSVTLMSPPNGNVTPLNSVNFTCNATDDKVLRNITFYWNYSGSFVANGTVNVNGTFNWSSFFRANLSNGMISWNCRVCDNASQCSFASANGTVTVNVSDTIYPQFSNYWDNNGSLTGSGSGLFNVTVLNTNGTVWLEINNTNITARNLTINVYNVSYVFASNGTYPYRWWAYGNGTNRNINNSGLRYYTVNATLDTTPPSITNPTSTPSLPATVNGSARNFSVNFTSSEYPINITFRLYNSTGSVVATQGPTTISSPSGLPINFSLPAGLADGVYSLNMTANDSSGNSNTTALGTITVDATAPFIAIISPANTTYNTKTILVNISTSGASYIWYTNYSGQNVTYVSPANAWFNEGSNTLRAWANDSAGNLNFTFVNFVVDTCVPNMTNSSAGSWSNTTCSGIQMNQSRNFTQYDTNNCGEVSNQTFFEYQFVGPTYQNTSWSGWLNISCLFGDKMNQTRNLTRFDVYSCASNTTFIEYRATEYCAYCTPNMTNTSWSAWSNQGSCKIDDLQLQNRSKIEYDSNNCGAFVNYTHWGYQNVSCNYCSYNVTNTTWGAWNNISCLISDTMNQTRNKTEYDSNYGACYAVTGLPSDLWNSGNNNTYVEYRNTEFCNYCTESITGPFNTSCNSSNRLTQYYSDANYASCCVVTGIVSDCSINNNPSYANQTLVCVFDSIAPSFNTGNTRPIAGSQYNQTQTIILVANPSESSSVFANISWDSTSEIVNLGYNGTSWYYNSTFANTTYPGIYAVVINATDSSGNSNVTTTNFVINDVRAPSVGNIVPSAGTAYNPSMNVNITANVTDYYYDSVASVIAQITYPNGTAVNYSLVEIDNTQIFNSLLFAAPSLAGRYNVTIIASDASGNVNSSASWFNVTLSDVTPPNIGSTTISPYDPAVGTNVFLNASASDASGISGIFANLTLPNGTVLRVSLPNSYNVTLPGRYDVTFWANDTKGNVASFSDYFIAGVSLKNVIFNVVGSNLSGIPVNLTLYFAGTDKSIELEEFIGQYVDNHTDILYDLYYRTIGGDATIRLNGVNLSLYLNGTLGVDRSYSVPGYLVVYGINSTYDFTNAVVRINYAGSGFGDESNLVLEKCDNWDFVNWNCLGSWTDITSQSTQDTAGDYFEANATSFSGFGIREITAAAPVSSGGGGGRAVVQSTASVALNTSLLEISLLQGEGKTGSISLTNNGSRDLNISLSLKGLDGLAKLPISKFVLGVGMSQQFNVEFYAPSNMAPGVYTGKITIDTGFGTKIVNVIVVVKERSALFDVVLDVTPETKRVGAGELVDSVTSFHNMGAPTDVNISLTLFVANFNKKILFEASRESFIMQKNESLIRKYNEFSLPGDFEAGQYMLLAKVTYDGHQAESYDTFEIVKKCRISIWDIIMLLILLGELIWLIILVVRRRRKRKVLRLEELVHAKVTHPLMYEHKPAKHGPGMMHGFYLFFAGVGKLFDEFAYSLVDGMRKTGLAVYAGVNGLLEGVAGFIIFLVDGAKRLITGLVEALEVFVSGTVEFLSSLVYGVGMFLRNLAYGIESDVGSLAHGAKLAERRAVRSAVRVEEGAVSDIEGIFARLGAWTGRLIDFVIYGIGTFIRNLAIGITAFFAALFVGVEKDAESLAHEARLAERRAVRRAMNVERGMLFDLKELIIWICFAVFDFVRFLVYGILKFFRNFAYGIAAFFGALIYGVESDVGSLAHGAKLAERRAVRSAVRVEEGAVSDIAGIFTRLGAGVGKLVDFVVYGIAGFFRGLFYGVKRAEGKVVKGTVKAERGALSDFTAIFYTVGRGIADLARFLIYGIKMFVKGIGRVVVGLFFGLVKFLKSVFKGIWKLLSGFFGIITGFVFGAVEFVGSLVYSIGKFAHNVVYGVERDAELLAHKAELLERKSVRGVSKFGSGAMSSVERFFIGILESLQGETSKISPTEEIIIEKLPAERAEGGVEGEPAPKPVPRHMNVFELNAEKNKLKIEVKRLDAEYKNGTLDTRGYLRTRETLLGQLWELKSGGHY